MGNICGFNCFSRTRSNGLRDYPVDIIGNSSYNHEGIKTVGIQKCCEFSSESTLCICVVTWNMNGKASTEDIMELVGSERRYDILAIGLQEVPRKNVSKMFQKTLSDTHCLLGEVTLQSLQLFVFGPKKYELKTKDVQSDKQSIGGCGGLIRRKKGAVGIYINFNGIRIAFISCHLSAHAHNVEERNKQFNQIAHTLFTNEQKPYDKPSHLTVWLGDFNYRIQGISTKPARNMIHSNLLNPLSRKDQLLQEAEKGKVFNGYSEGALSFNPTYKYDVGTSNYDTSYKIRVPSWTDRILFKIDNSSGIDVLLHSYDSVDQIESSDHKPVKAHLCLKLDNM